MCDTPLPKTVTICGHKFSLVQAIQPERDSRGRIKRFYPHRKYRNKRDLSLSRYGAGPFCRFSIKAKHQPGVYVLLVEGDIVYIGETVDLRQRFNAGYGRISPRACFKPRGQTTNTKVNRAILEQADEGQTVVLYFKRSKKHKQLERELLSRIHPPLNTKYNLR